MDETRCPLILRDQLAVHVTFNAAIIQHALENWPSSHASHVAQNDTGPYFYKDSVYQQLVL